MILPYYTLFTATHTHTVLTMINPQDLPDNFYLSLAVGVQPFEDILRMHEIPQEDASELEAHPIFKQRLLLAQELVEDTGQAFRARCRSIANDALQHIRALLRDTATPPSVQLEAFKTIAKYGKLEPEPPSANQHAGPTGPQLTLTIIAPNGETAFTTAMTNSLPAPKHIQGTVLDDLPALPAYPEEDDDWADPPDLPVSRASAVELGFALP